MRKFDHLLENYKNGVFRKWPLTLSKLTTCEVYFKNSEETDFANLITSKASDWALQ